MHGTTNIKLSWLFLFLSTVTGKSKTCPGYFSFCPLQEGYQTPILVIPSFCVVCKRDIKNLSWLFLFLSTVTGKSKTCPGYSSFCPLQEGYQTPILVIPSFCVPCKRDIKHLFFLVLLFLSPVTGISKSSPGYSFLCPLQDGYQTCVAMIPSVSHLGCYTFEYWLE